MFADRIKTPLLLYEREQRPQRPASPVEWDVLRTATARQRGQWVSYITAVTVCRYYSRGSQGLSQADSRLYDSHLKGDLKKKAEAQKADVPQLLERQANTEDSSPRSNVFSAAAKSPGTNRSRCASWLFSMSSGLFSDEPKACIIFTALTITP